MAFLLYVTTPHSRPSPQVIFDGVDKPFLNEGIRGRLWHGEPRRITAGEEADLRAGAVTLDELAARYPAALIPMGAAHG